MKVGITVNGLEHIDYLPVMDFKNKPVRIDAMTSTDVNKAIQRSTAKAIAMHGLGIQMWTGEDLPDIKPEPKELPLLKEGTPEYEKVVNWIKGLQDKDEEKILSNIRTKFTIRTAIISKLKKVINE